MNKLITIYPQAIEHTKKKIFEDMNNYLETRERLPSYEQYLSDRKQYLEQIWVNVWINKATNDVSKKEKKSFLYEKGYEVEGVDRKLINHLFRTEMKEYQRFNVMNWLESTNVQDHEKWETRYEQARQDYLVRKKEEEIAEKRKNAETAIENAAKDIIDERYEILYLHVRHIVSKQLVKDLTNNPKFQTIDTFKIEEKLVPKGNFKVSNYTFVGSFLDELTGTVHKTFQWEYETYYYYYDRVIRDYLFEFVPKWLLEELPPTLVEYYQISVSVLRKVIADSLYLIQMEFLSKIQEEYLEDILTIASLPFDEANHKAIYEQDLAKREQKRAEELAEYKRQVEREERMLEDIFGREYRPNTGRNIKYVLHIGETNTGKTHHALQRMKEGESGIYLAPLRLLALEVYDKLNNDDVTCGLKTGEEEKDLDGATHISCTVEMFHEKEFYDVVVIDEAQMIADKDRGFSWYKAITKANANEVHIIGSLNSKSMILQLLGDSDIEIHKYNRDIPLEVESKEFSMKHTKKGDALVCFSRRRVLETASRLQNNGHSVSMIYGSMPPETRKKQMQRFIQGETKVIVATDAIGMGLNLPIRRIVFLENEKFDGVKRRRLTSQEVKQIAGRAGRKGIYNVGKVAFTKDIKLMNRLLNQEDIPVHTFAIAPTSDIFERFQKYYRDLGAFFDLWEKFESPIGTKKATLSEEKELYTTIRGTEIEGRLSLMDLYGFLHLPFSNREPGLTYEWRQKMLAIVRGTELPEPKITKDSLEDLELSYKSVGLHLLFLYRLDKRTEAIYWERIRGELSDEVHERLKTDVKNMTKKCKHCGKKLEIDFAFPICNRCHSAKYKRRQYFEGDEY
ncbi:DEAD/DEAH box helicase [Bacillus sp. FJAT-45350]|uniref:DEAD/DEAH box helicase n=1 Tax=Bacillus sp. FJAT-45350 TaxID=2011014 RepID=UPI000BB84D35|nr:DEAD/DEAH box helicase [Bacillus sp. FJAT-45350]